MADPEQKTDDKKMIEMEEQLNMLNKDESKKTEETNEEQKDVAAAKNELREGMETKPKKIPIGGIQMPGFFTRSRSKEKCKDGEPDQGDVEGAELLEPSEKKEETSLMSQARIKLPNPFRKSKVSEDDKNDASGGEKSGNCKFINAIRLPLVSVKKKKTENLENQAATPGLASSETLDDNDKTADKEKGMKNVPLDDKDPEKQDLEEKLMSWKERIKAYRLIISALLLFILITIIIIAVTCSGEPLLVAPSNGKYVQTVTNCGKVEGIRHDGGIAFRGIPYARPPIGELRFKYAQPINDLEYCWNSTSVLKAHNQTDFCVQLYSNGTISGNEDCLTLDIMTPYVRYDNPLPVIVLIGAESLVGGSPGKMRPSARYARAKDVIYVRPNFRMGALGFLALDELSKSTYPISSGNYGVSDIVAALQWIQYNIVHFGGNKEAVTLFGHQAGATIVTALTTMHRAEKLFSRAWATSGGAVYPTKPLTDSESANKPYLDAIGCADATCLREKSAEELTKAIIDTWRKPSLDLMGPQEDPAKHHKWLVTDGNILRQPPINRWTYEKAEDDFIDDSNGAIKVKLVLGATAHAGASEKLRLKHTNWTEDDVISHVTQSKLKVLNLTDYALSRYNKTYKGITKLISDVRVVCPLLHLSTKIKNTPFYVVTQTRGDEDLADPETDVDAILGRYEPKTPEQRRYVSSMQQLFYHYVYHGEIQHKETHKILVIGQDGLPADRYSECKFWIDNKVVPEYAQVD